MRKARAPEREYEIAVASRNSHPILKNDFEPPNMELDFMRYELTDYEWSAIKLLLPNKPRGVARVDDRRVLNGIFWILRSDAPWRDLPESLGPYSSSYNRFVCWRRAGVWSRIMSGLATIHDASVQMIDICFT
jgi:transposase